MLQAKLGRQAEIAERHADLKPTVRVKDATPIAVGDFIRSHARALSPSMSFGELRLTESIAGRAYWQVLARMPVRFKGSWAVTVPEHWHTAGPRTSHLDKKRARLAQTPAHAILNYLYAILETEAIIAAHRLGFDPSLGLMHTDLRYRSSLAIDLMEPIRPVADEIAMHMLSQRKFRRGEVVETGRGVCRLGPALARELAHHSPAFRTAVAPHAEQLARTLLKEPRHPTPLTRAQHRKAVAAR